MRKVDNSTIPSSLDVPEPFTSLQSASSYTVNSAPATGLLSSSTFINVTFLPYSTVI